MVENYDSTWIWDSKADYENYRYQGVRIGSSSFSYTYPEQKIRIDVDPGWAEKLTSIMKYSDKEIAMANGISASEQKEIDDAVRDAIARPRVLAEIANRTAAVEALGAEDKYEVGTVLTFKRKSGKEDKLHVAIKTGDDQWYGTGHLLAGTGHKTWESLLTWMTTGDHLVSEVKVLAAVADITWTVASADEPAKI